jgi:hypothetical protein
MAVLRQRLIARLPLYQSKNCDEQIAVKLSKTSALMGGVIVAVEAIVSVTLWTSQDAKYLAEAFWPSIVPQTAIASLILLLPAIALLFAGPFRALAEKASLLYPLLLIAQFWLIASTLDGLATPLIFLFFVTPIAVLIAVGIFITGVVTGIEEPN